MMSKFVLLLVACVAAVALGTEEDVVVGTVDNFDKIIAENELVMVEFYAPWCGHCKKLAPEYAQAAGDLKGQAVVIMKVDATEEQPLGEKYEIRGYPTIKVFRNGEPEDYEGGRTAGDITSYIKKQMGPAVKGFTSSDELEAFIPTDKGEPVVIAYTEEGSELDTSFSAFAQKHRNSFAFGRVSDKALLSAKGEKADTIVVYKPFDNKRAVFSGEQSDTKALLEFIQLESIPLVDEIGPQNYRSYVDRGLPIIWLFVDPAKEAEVEAAKAEYAKVAPEFRQLSFVWLNGVQYNQMVTKMALTGEKFPCLAIETTAGDHFPFSETEIMTADAMRAWLTKFVSGELKAHLRSAPIPEEPTEEGVTVVVGDNYNDVVLNKDKDVFVEFYAPWCGHCKKLTPIFSKLAESVKDVETMTIAKMDATVNDAPGQQIQGFPTLKLFKAGENEVVEYEGGRTEEEMLAWLQETAQHKFKA